MPHFEEPVANGSQNQENQKDQQAQQAQPQEGRSQGQEDCQAVYQGEEVELLLVVPPGRWNLPGLQRERPDATRSGWSRPAYRLGSWSFDINWRKSNFEPPN